VRAAEPIDPESARVQFPGQTLGPLGLQSPGDGLDGRVLVVEAGQPGVVVHGQHQVTTTHHVEPGVAPAPGQAHIDALPAGGVGGEVAPGLVGLALGHVGGDGVGVGDLADHAGADPLQQMGLGDLDAAPPVEVDDHSRMAAGLDLHDLTALAVVDEVGPVTLVGSQVTVLFHGHHLAPHLERLARHLD